MTPGRPAGAPGNERGVINGPDDDFAPRQPGALHLSMAFQAKIKIPFDEHLGINGTVRHMANRAAFPHRVVFVDPWASLFLMALRTGLRGSRRMAKFGDCPLRGVMALRAIGAE